MKTVLKVAFLAAAVLSMSACKPVPTCDSDDAKELLSDIFNETIDSGGEYGYKLNYEYSAIVEEKRDYSVGRTYCSGVVKVTEDRSNLKKGTPAFYAPLPQFPLGNLHYSVTYTNDNHMVVELISAK